MRPLRSMICIKSPTKRRSQFPSLRVKKSAPRFQEFLFSSKTEIIINRQSLPIQLTVEKEGQKIVIVSLGSQLIKIQDLKSTKMITHKLYETEKKWIHLHFGEMGLKSKIKVFKKADENTSVINSLFTSFDQWKKYCPCENSKTLYSLSVQCFVESEKSKKTICQAEQKKVLSQQDSQNQVKNFVSALMAKKLSKRNNQIQSNRNSLKKVGILKRHGQTTKNSFNDQIAVRQSLDSALGGMRNNVKLNLHRISKIKIAKSNLKDSIFTGKSQKDTSAGGEKSILHFNRQEQEKHFQSSQWTIDLDKNEYSRRLKKFQTTNLLQIKFDPQSIFTQQTSICKQNHLKSVNQGLAQKQEKKQPQVQSQFEEVAQQINTQSKVRLKKSQCEKVFEKSQFGVKQKCADQSSSLYQSRMVSSRDKAAVSDSGTLYESRYQED